MLPAPRFPEQPFSIASRCSPMISCTSKRRQRRSSARLPLDSESCPTFEERFCAASKASCVIWCLLTISNRWSFARASIFLNCLKSSFFFFKACCAFACTAAAAATFSEIFPKDASVARDCCSTSFFDCCSFRTFSRSAANLAFICATCSFCSRLRCVSCFCSFLNSTVKLLRPTTSFIQPESAPSSFAPASTAASCSAVALTSNFLVSPSEGSVQSKRPRISFEVKYCFWPCASKASFIKDNLKTCKRNILSSINPLMMSR
mmetsp:Transcript_92261/g.192951  ORF Transcript_92261/g.192951 Transcript_92261/m.192951 type:complete len:262 (-) Transcript_92261:1964-2749(-)